MFTNIIPSSDKLLQVKYGDYAAGHFLMDFEKKYPGLQWVVTNNSIMADLSRLRMPNNDTQKSSQIDELRHNGDYWLAKFDFRVAKTKESTKTSGSRCIVFIDNSRDSLSILLIYNKNHLPKNKDETAYIFDVLKEQYPDYEKKLRLVFAPIKR